jgi:hypothetical protein
MAPVVFIFLGHTFGDIPLSYLAKFYFLTLALLSVFHLTKTYRQINLNSLSALFLHPSFILLILFFIFFKIKGFTTFEAQMWDEFSHWMMMPKQFYFFDRFISIDFPYTRLVTYTPGWSVALIFPELILKDLFSSTWDPHSLVYCPLFLGVICVSFVFDFFKHFAQKINIQKSTLVSWLVLASVFVGEWLFIFSQSVLIEDPQIFILVLLFTFIWAWSEALFTDFFAIAFLSIVLGFCYLVKDSSILIAAPVFLAALFMRKITFRNFIFFFIPLLVFFGIWKFHTHGYEPIFYLINDTPFMELLQKRMVVIFGMIELISWTFGDLENIILLSLLVIVCLFSKKERPAALAVIFYLLLTVVALLWMYLTVFSEYEANLLTSIQRYMKLSFYSYRMMTYLFVVKILLTKIPQKIWTKKPAQLVALALVLLSSLKMNNDLRDIYTLKLNRIQQDAIITQGQALARLLDKKNQLGAETYIVAQTSNESEYYKGMYASLYKKGRAYKLLDGVSWGDKKENVWMRVLNRQELFEKFKKADVLWIVHTNPWVEEILSSLVNPINCTTDWNKYFLIKSDDSEKFYCYLKEGQ